MTRFLRKPLHFGLFAMLGVFVLAFAGPILLLLFLPVVVWLWRKFRRRATTEEPQWPEHWHVAGAGSPRRFPMEWLEEGYATSYAPGAAPLGRLLPVPGAETPCEVWVPADRRTTHVEVAAPTESGKTTRVILPWMLLDAFADCTAITNDAKGEEMFSLVAPLYWRQGKPVHYFAPWARGEAPRSRATALEPLWRATPTELDEWARSIVYYIEPRTSGHGEQHWTESARKVLLATFALVRHWPRRMCNIPVAVDALNLGPQFLSRAFQQAAQLYRPERVPEVCRSVAVLVGAPTAQLEPGAPRSRAVREALAVVDPLGPDVAALVSEGRAKRLQPRPSLWDQSVRRAFEKRRQELHDGQRYLADLMAEEGGRHTASVVSSTATMVAPFQERSVAAAFSREEINIEAVVREAGLVVLDSPMEITGAGRVVSPIMQALIRHGRESYRDGSRRRPLWMYLDEVPQLGMRELPNLLATIRSQRMGAVITWQTVGQLDVRHGKELDSISGNCLTQVVLRRTHKNTAKAIESELPQVTIREQSVQRGIFKPNGHSESVRRVPLLAASAITQMRINGKVRHDAALVRLGALPALVELRPYWEQPWAVKALELREQGGRMVPREQMAPLAPRRPCADVYADTCLSVLGRPQISYLRELTRPELDRVALGLTDDDQDTPLGEEVA